MKVIRNAQVFADGRIAESDIVIDDGKITGLTERGGGPPDAEEIDATGLTALPGGVDVHVHTREPGYTHKEDLITCTSAAAAGGYTTIFGMPNLDPPTMTADDLDAVLGLYDRKSIVDYNHNPAAKLVDQIPALAERGIAAYKIYMVTDTGRSYPHPSAIGVHDHGELYLAMKAIAETGLRLMVHPHDQAIMDVVEQSYWAKGDRSPQAYGKTLAVDDGIIWDTATATLIRMAEATGCKLHIVHVQTTRQIDMLRRARSAGIDVTSEVNHWALFLGRMSDIDEQGSYVLSYYVPDHHREALWAAMEEGVIDMLSSDHAPHTREEKEIGWSDAWAAHTGTPGIQHQLQLMIDAHHDGKVSLPRLVDLVSTAPARVFGLVDKGELATGRDADIVLVDFDREVTLTNADVLSKIGWTPYHGRTVRGSVERTLVRGTDVWAEGSVTGQPGFGQHVHVEVNR